MIGTRWLAEACNNLLGTQFVVSELSELCVPELLVEADVAHSHQQLAHQYTSRYLHGRPSVNMSCSVKHLDAEGHKIVVVDQGDERAIPLVLLHRFLISKIMYP